MTHSDAPSLSRTIAGWVDGLRLADVPEPVRETAREHALDAIGIAIASSGMDFGEAMHRAVRGLGTGDAAHGLGFGTALPAASAALVNGTLMHGLDFDDTHIGAIYHATGPALAAALAVGEEQGATGEAVLTAFIAGLEVGCRLAAAGAGQFHARGFHPTGIAGTFAAACVAVKLRGGGVDAMTRALGLAGSQAAGILEIHGSWLKRMHPGWAAHAGVVAAALGEAGFRGPESVFEGSGGVYRSHLEMIPTAEQLGLTTLGERWMTAEIALKPYPCCHFTHAFADAAFAGLDELGVERLDAEEIAWIEAPTSTALHPMVCEPAAQKTAPATIYDALFSVQYVVARALSTRRVDLAAFYDEPLDDPEVLAVAAKVRITEDPASDFPTHFPGEVAIGLNDGRQVRHRIPASFGTSEWPMPTPAVREKFRANAGRRIDPAQADALAELMDRLEQLDDIAELMAATAAAASAPTGGVS